MNARTIRWNLILLAVTMPFMLACLYLERLVDTPEPKMESNADTVLQVLNGTDWVHLQSLANETYTQDDFAKPGTLTFTMTVTNDKPVYFSYGWCTTTHDILQQNLQHITVQLYLNDQKLGSDVAHSFAYGLANGQVCDDVGVLMSDWPPGEYHLKAIATFDAKINDGMGDYPAGDYIYDYTVTVNK